MLGKHHYALKISNGFDRWEDYILWATQAGYAGWFAPTVYWCQRSKHGVVALMERLDGSVRNIGSTELKDACNALGRRRVVPPLLEAAYPGLRAFLTAVVRAGFADDIAARNMMLRGGRQLVLTDPALKYTTLGEHEWRVHGNRIMFADDCTR